MSGTVNDKKILSVCCLTLAAFIDHKLVFDQFSKDLIAAAVFEAGDGSQKAHRNDLVVLHAHLYLFKGNICQENDVITAQKTQTKDRELYNCY